ncbi:two component transcriptional regulator, LuxR family [Rhodopirellula sallentina SM41]|uniref:Two component transcriptional regulator, LuxR family n=1 Tax=Rhodopirellula sallentina SM41 TaxID=1263870 RepID=M5U6H9_9BACT|nr:two component transcriptional regulator, LuxR family [Rhodopirellula sallentina SM41]
MDEVTKVMLVEDHPKYRRVVEMAINAEPTITLVSMFGAAEIALRHLSDADLPDLPHIILLDLNLPGMSGLDALTQFLAVVPEAKIIVLTQSNAEADIEKAIQSGASGYLLKSSTIQQIVEGIHTVANGGASLDDEVASHLLKMVQNHPKKVESDVVLSTREREILTLLSQGLLKKEIANELGISYGSVATYIRRLYEKLDVQNAPAAIDKAHRIGVFKHTDEPRSAE